MPLSYCYPDDGTVDFIESFPIWDFHDFVTPAMLGLTGALCARPAFALHSITDNADGGHILEPEFQIYSRSWVGSGSAPDWSSEIAGQGWAWPGPLLAYEQVLDEEDPESTVRGQSRWRLAWKTHQAADTTKRNPWNWVHLRFKEATYFTDTIGMSPIGVEPDGVSALVTKKWQREIDHDPVGYDPDDPLTWPGTDWQETPVPSGGSPHSVTYWYPRLPNPWFFVTSLQPTPHIVPRPTLKQGLIPGWRRFSTDHEHPKFASGNTLA